MCLRNISVDTLHKGDTEDNNNNNNNITIMNVVSSGLEVLSYVTHSFGNNTYLNSKVGIILGLYIQFSSVSIGLRSNTAI